jgi:predicted nucleic acid-binding protein
VKWLLDTNVVSEGARDRPTQSVIEWIKAKPVEDLAISIVTLAELQDGAHSNANETRRRKLTGWIETEISGTFHGRILTLSADVLIDWLRLSRRLRAKGLVRDASDLLIAATARVHELRLVTRNTRHFTSTGVIVYDPWNNKTYVMDAI